jgi:hypothetical protein
MVPEVQEGFLTEFVGRYSPQIKQLFGGLDDIRATKEYNKAIRELKEFQTAIDRSDKFLELEKKLGNVPVGVLPTTTKDIKQGYDFTHPNWVGSDTEKGFLEYFSTINPNAKEYTPEDVQVYIEKKGIKDSIPEGVYGDREVQRPLTIDELKQKRFELAEFKPEDVEFFNKYIADNYSPKAHNRKLLDMVAKKTHLLSSTGELGNVKLQQFKDKTLLLQMLEEENPEWKFIFKDGKLIKYNDRGDYDLVYEEEEIPDWEPDGVEKDASGRFYFFRNEFRNGKWTQTPLRYLTDKESALHQQELDKIFQEGDFLKTNKDGRSGRIGGTGKGETKEEKEERLERERKEKQNKIIKKKSEKFHSQWMGAGLDKTPMSGLVTNWAGDIINKVTKSNDEYTASRMEQNERVAYERVIKWVRSLEAKWGRDLTTEEWIAEFDKHDQWKKWSPEEERQFGLLLI